MQTTGLEWWQALLAPVPAGIVHAASLAFGACLLVSAALTPVVAAVARRSGLLDHTLSSRKIHGRPVPRLGGVAIVVAFYAPLVALSVGSDVVSSAVGALGREGLVLVAGGLCIAAVGVYDDVRGAGARTKFTAQIAVAAVAYALGIRIDAVALPGGPALELGALGLPVTVLWIVAVINAWNLIDGLDGLAGGLALIALATLAGLALAGGQPHAVLVAAGLGGAVLGFLFFNFHPASVFMGDSGSMFLGFALATATIRAQRSSDGDALVVAGVALGLPLLDTALAVVRRVLRGAPVFAGDRGHLHHALLRLGCSHRRAVTVLYGAAAVLGVVALALSGATRPQALALLGAVSAGTLLALRRLGYLRLSALPALRAQRRRNGALRASVRSAAAHLREAGHAADVWNAVSAGARGLGADGVTLAVAGFERSARFAPDGARGVKPLRSTHSVAGERTLGARLELEWGDGRSFDRDTEIAVEGLCEHIRRAVRRLGDGDRSLRAPARPPLSAARLPAPARCRVPLEGSR